MATLENKIHKKEEKLFTHMNILEYQLAFIELNWLHSLHEP